MKSVTIASGKGGAGKTTLAALLSLRAADEVRLVLADADVEASNLPLALGASASLRAPFEGGSTAVVNPGSCTACGACASYCRFDAISATPVWEDAPYYEVDPWACEGCGLCSMVCPQSAISMEPTKAGNVYAGSWARGSVTWGQLEPGEDLSGKLVTEVRRLATVSAQEAEADVMLVDGPPGVGCPTIASLADTDLLVAVTEPTVSGEHDLGRLLDLAKRLDIEAIVVLNKADLSQPGREGIEALCAAREVPCVAQIPFDERLASALDTMSSRGPDATTLADVAHAPYVDDVWNAVASRLSFA